MNRVGQMWTNNRGFFLCVDSHESKPKVWRHTFAELESSETCVFEERARVDWKSKELSYWRRVDK